MQLYNGYGMSESSGPATACFPHMPSFDSAGQKIMGTDIKIVNQDKDGNGEICFKGRNKFMGYFKNKKNTVETIDQDGYIHSGDVGKIDERGFLTITGRIKELIITAGGENVAPILIEDKFKEFCPIVSNIMIIGDDKKFLSAIMTFKVDIDMKNGQPTQDLTPEVKNHLAAIGSSAKTVSEALADKKVTDYVKKAMDDTNKLAISRAQFVRKWEFVKDDFSIPGGELTPTMKLKRKVVDKKYESLIAKIYEEGKL
jgi:long-chain-fatty-acid--CoA ligase ACSBG